MRIFQTLFGDILVGQLGRRGYLGYSILLEALFFGFIVFVVLSVGLAEPLIVGDLAQAEEELQRWITIPGLLVLGVFFTATLLATLNLTAKRLRDMGLPAGKSLFAILAAQVLISFIAPGMPALLVQIVVWIGLLFVPTGAFNASADEAGKD